MPVPSHADRNAQAAGLPISASSTQSPGCPSRARAR